MNFAAELGRDDHHQADDEQKDMLLNLSATEMKKAGTEVCRFLMFFLGFDLGYQGYHGLYWLLVYNGV